MLHADVLFLLQDFKRGITQFDFLGGLKIENFSLFPFLNKMAIQISNLAAFDTKQQCSNKQSIIPYSLKKKRKRTMQ